VEKVGNRAEKSGEKVENRMEEVGKSAEKVGNRMRIEWILGGNKWKQNANKPETNMETDPETTGN
jgi:hypothetical protein